MPMFLEIQAGYQREDDDTDWEALDMPQPDDYEYEVSPTLIPIDKILRVNSCDGDQHTFILLDSPGESVKAVEPYDVIKKRLEDIGIPEDHNPKYLRNIIE